MGLCVSGYFCCGGHALHRAAERSAAIRRSTTGYGTLYHGSQAAAADLEALAFQPPAGSTPLQPPAGNSAVLLVTYAGRQFWIVWQKNGLFLQVWREMSVASTSTRLLERGASKPPSVTRRVWCESTARTVHCSELSDLMTITSHCRGFRWLGDDYVWVPAHLDSELSGGAVLVCLSTASLYREYPPPARSTATSSQAAAAAAAVAVVQHTAPAAATSATDTDVPSPSGTIARCSVVGSAADANPMASLRMQDAVLQYATPLGECNVAFELTKLCVIDTRAMWGVAENTWFCPRSARYWRLNDYTSLSCTLQTPLLLAEEAQQCSWLRTAMLLVTTRLPCEVLLVCMNTAATHLVYARMCCDRAAPYAAPTARLLLSCGNAPCLQKAMCVCAVKDPSSVFRVLYGSNELVSVDMACVALAPRFASAVAYFQQFEVATRKCNST